MSGKPAIFFDRDGNLNRDVGYVVHLDDYELLPRAAAAVRLVNEAGHLAILVTNQAGVARGYFPEEMLARVHEKLQVKLGEKGAHLDAIYYCASLPGSNVPGYDEDSDWRKPKPGMLLQAAADHDIDLSRSFMMGDKYSDLECGWAAGCKSAFVLTGYGRGERELRGDTWRRQPDVTGEDAYHAVELILEEMVKTEK